MKCARFLLPALAVSTLHAAYTYYVTDNMGAYDPAKWTTTWSNSIGGPIMSTVAVPDGSSDVEIRSSNYTGHILQGWYRYEPNGGVNNRLMGYYYVQPTQSTYPCTTTISVYAGNYFNGTTTNTLIASTTLGCPAATEMRTVALSTYGQPTKILVYYNSQKVMEVNATGATPGPWPGFFGASGTIQLGPRDRIAPNAVVQSSIGTSLFPSRVDAQWTAATDDANGTGVYSYRVYRQGVFWTEVLTPSFSDQTVSPGTQYTYTLYAVDWHGNVSAGTSFNVTTPGLTVNPTIHTPPMRTGVRPTGAYWGAGSEQIDTLSGNVNFSLPLVKSKARGGWGATITLSYNSQQWRKDSGGTWKLGSDVGYGFGWRLMAGSIAPWWNPDATLSHYVFTDSTGAEYKLDVNTGGVWTSRESVYVAYDGALQKLYFNDGSFWHMGAVSGGSEPDAGTRYPDWMQDSNGNYLS